MIVIIGNNNKINIVLVRIIVVNVIIVVVIVVIVLTAFVQAILTVHMKVRTIEKHRQR